MSRRSAVGSPARQRSRLWARVALVGFGVAGVTAVVAGVVSAGLVYNASREVQQQTLSDQADVVAGQLDDVRVAGRRVTEILEGQGVAVVRQGPDGRAASKDPRATRAARRAGLGDVTAEAPVHREVSVGGAQLLVEGRALGDGRGAVALVREAEISGGTARRLLRNVLLALCFGILAATGAGVLFGTVLARPLRRTAQVAVSMSHGRRDLRVPLDGPKEVVEVGESINALADALARSEARQREFLMSVSHELRTPLTSVRGFAESLADGVVGGDEVPAVGRTIEREANRLDQLVSDLLDLARLGADDFRLDIAEVDLSSLLREAAQVWAKRCAAAGVVFLIEQPATPVPVRTDPRRVRQIVDGLASNAVRATPAGRPVVLALHVYGTAAVVEVRDGGPGLSTEDYHHAFERGVLHARYEGTRPVGAGIGLALVHGLVTRLGGTIDAGPAPEGGARFSVRLQTVG